MTESTQAESATPQDVMATLRDLLQTLREVLARMPIARESVRSGDDGARRAGQELADMMHGARPTAPMQQSAN